MYISFTPCRISELDSLNVNVDVTNDTTQSKQFHNPVRKMVETDKIDTPITYIHDRSFFWLGTSNSITSDTIKLV
jgi:exopolysaccharide biosynthesis protein